jgi:transcriptional regulator
METVFFFRSSPASNNPRAGIINNTKLEATSIQAMSPEFIVKTAVEKNFIISITKDQMLKVKVWTTTK